MTDVTDSKDVGWFNSSVDEAWWHKPLQRLLSAGPLPRHIAFVMDGNRRYARSHGSSTVIDGHIKGFEQLTKILRWCRDLCVEEVTIYAFSIENFKRPKDEVDGLMELFSKKLKQLLDEKKQLTENDVAVRFFGRLSVLPISHQRMIAQIMRLTSEHKARVVNVCIAYTAQDEITRAFEYIRKGIQKGMLQEDDISESLISKCLDSRLSRDPDMLIRTSGENRLSDFLLWQCSSCYIHFDSVLWPEFGYWNLCSAILAFQRNHRKIQQAKRIFTSESKMSERVFQFLSWVESERQSALELMVQ